MKKNTQNNLSKRLLQYGALSAAVMGVADAAGQVTYVDIDPDQVLNVGDNFEIDFVGDAVSRADVSNPADLAGGNAAIVFPSSGGAFVGITAAGFEYPALLAEGDDISAASGYTTAGVRGDLNYYGCAYSNSQWCDTVVDGYLGVQFQFDGNTHYGWVRMDTDVAGSNVITIKDVAFNATPDEAIAAGDTGLSVEDVVFEGFNYAVTNNALTMSSKTAMENVTLYNVNGQEVINRGLNNTNEVVDLSSLSNGMYIATVTVDGRAKSFKIVK